MKERRNSNDQKIGMIGAGNMGSAILRGDRGCRICEAGPDDRF